MLVTGCTSFYPVDITTPDGLRVVDTGDFVRVVTTSGAEHEFEVTHVEPREIDGEGAHYTAAQVQTLERREHDVAESVGLTAGIAATTYVVIVVVALVAVSAVIG